MRKEVLEQLKALGADVSAINGKSLLEDLQALKFNTYLYDEDYIDIVGADIISVFLGEERIKLSDNIDEAADTVLNHFWNYPQKHAYDEHYLGQTFFKGELFAPFDKTSEDYEEWKDWFENEADLSEVAEVVGDVAEPSFVNVFGSHGFPDNYYICLQDPNPENPTVFGTDHEAFFVEVENYGSLEDFLGMMLTKEELRTQIKDYLEYLKNEK